MNRLDENNFESFLGNIRKNSLLVKKYGSFLEEQIELLKLFYNLYCSGKRIISLTAPPASGKTHVILLLIKYLIDKNLKVGLIIPFQELIQDFKESTMDIINLHAENLEIMSLNEYLSSNGNFEIILIDEAHNLKSSLEINRKFVKTIEIKNDHQCYSLIKNKYFPPNIKYQSIRLNSLTLKNILKEFKDFSEFKYEIKDIYLKLSEWIGILYLSPMKIEISLIKGKIGDLFSKDIKRIILFSATPLNIDELDFYCNFDINQLSIEEIKIIKDKTERRKNLYILQEMDINSKCGFLISLLNKIEKKSLILTSKSSTSQMIYDYLVETRADLFIIPANIRPKERITIFKQYDKLENGVLISSSNIYWEGINIKNLKLLIIFDIPAPRPSLMELYKDYKLKTRNLISRRLKQGIGRIGRKRGEFGIVLLMFNPKTYLKNKKITSINIWDTIDGLKDEFSLRGDK